MQKLYCPERGIGGIFRRFWHIGVEARMSNANLHPSGTHVWEIHNRIYHEYMEPHFGSFNSLLLEGASANPLDITHEKPADREVIEDPDKLLWKFKDGDVSEQVVNMLTKRIPYERIEKIVKTHYKGVLV